MSETLRRALRLLALLQLRTVWTGPELARELGVPERSVRRDVQRLRALGYPVHSERGRGGGYQLGTGQRLPPLLLEPDEAVAVGVGLRLAAASGITGLEKAAARSFARLEQMVESSLKDRIGRWASVLEVVRGGPETDVEVLLTLTGAVQRSRHALIDYVTSDGRAGRRRIEPYRVVSLGSRWYLFAWDLDREDWRTFRLDRIRGCRASTFEFTPRPTPDVQEHLRRSVALDPHRHRATIRFLVPLAEAQAVVPPEAGALSQETDRTCLLATCAEDLRDIAAHLGLLGLPFVVLGPPQLTGVVGEMGDRLVSAARISPSPGRTDG